MYLKGIYNLYRNWQTYFGVYLDRCLVSVLSVFSKPPPLLKMKKEIMFIIIVKYNIENPVDFGQE